MGRRAASCAGGVLGVVALAVGWSLWAGRAARAQQEEAPVLNASGLKASVEEYVVQPGDTLWGICERIVGAGYLWPRVWAMNPEMTNPNWIYPGDMVRFYPSSQPLPHSSGDPALAAREPTSETSDIAKTDVASSAGEQPLVEVVKLRAPARVDVIDRRRRAFAGMFVSAQQMQEAGVLTNAVADKVLLANGDLVYITFPEGAAVSAGDRFMVYRTLEPVYHPEGGALVGYLTQVTGFVSVQTFVDNVARAHLDDVIFEVERGQLVTPLVQSPMVDVVPTPAKTIVDGLVLAVGSTEEGLVGNNQLVYVDRGTAHGIERGYRFAVLGSRDELLQKDGLPEVRVGTLLVLEAKEATSTCLVLEAAREISRGARVRTVRR